MQYEFPEEMFVSVIGGLSILDVPRLRIDSREEAYEFILTYGYDLKNDKDLAEAIRIYKKTMDFFTSELLDTNEKIPLKYQKVETPQDFYDLLIVASKKEDSEDQIWACAILRVLHVVNHLRNGLFRTFSDKIQNQIFGLFYGHIHKDADGKYFMGNADVQIPLYDFEIKKYKSRASAAIKLLAKKNEFAMNILDRMGVRIVSHSLYDAFRALDYLISQHMISVPNITPDQSKNTLFPLDVFFDVMDKLSLQKRIHSEQEIDALLIKTLEHWRQEEIHYHEKENTFSSGNYKAIKFIARHMINIPIGKKNLRFFFPYEVQIIDRKTYEQTKVGDSAHIEYKNRQRKAAKDRAFGRGLKKED